MDVNRAIRNRRTHAHQPARNSRTSDLPSNDILSKLRTVVGPVSGSTPAWMRRTARNGIVGENLPLSEFWTVEAIAHDYLASQLTLKYCDPSDKEGAQNRKDKAIAKFMKAEEMCRLTNLRLKSSFKPKFQDRFDVGPIFFRAQRKIADLLRVCECPKGCSCIESLCNDYCDFGPGGTTSRSRRNGDKSCKFIGNNETTSGNLALALASLNARPLWLRGLLEEGATIVINDRDKIVTVPKNSEIDRVICSQPDLNVFTQKGYGKLLRRRLKTVGIDLDNQEVNQDFARLGSLFENLATIDLSMASDTLSIELVRQLLPCDWYLALEQCRVPETVLPCGTVHTYHKFSAMGNGYTFELETLIFWALVSACTEACGTKDRRVSVYGDDIICPVDTVHLVEDVLDYCGFVFNSDKSFWDSPFRESCGKHFFEGVDVTPFYVRRPVDSVEELFLLHNNVWRWVQRMKKFISAVRLRCWWSFLDYLQSLVPKAYKECRLPDGFGDGGLVGFFDFVRPRLARNGLDGYLIKVLNRTARVSNSSHHGWLCKALQGLEQTPPQDIWNGTAESTLAPTTGVFVSKIKEIFIPRSALG
jgi:hypothetical protein